MWYTKNICALLFISANVVYFCEAQKLKNEAYISVPKLIASAGYPVEKHRVTTDDGYVLQMHRIPAGRRSGEPGAKGKRSVLIMHGLLGSSFDFVIMGPERSLGFILADAGYDVWLGNLRGNWHTTHQTLKRNEPAFWEYSFHEHGKYDLPAMIDKVLNVTGLVKIMYIGYSMGTTSFFTMVAQKPEYNSKIVAFIAMAPAVYLNNFRPLATFLLQTVNLPKSMKDRGVISVTMTQQMTKFILTGICNFRNIREDLCSSIMYSIVGEDYEQNDLEMFSTVIAKLQPASWRQLEHFSKIALTGVFTSWEDGLWGTVKPYNLFNVKVPVFILYGDNDKLVEKSEIMRLADHLNKTQVLEDIRPGSSWPKFNHLDFIFAKDIGELLNRPLVKHVDKLYNKYGSI